MRNLNPLAEDSSAILREIVLKKRGFRAARLIAMIPKIEARFAEFADPRAALDVIAEQAYSALEREDLLHCYDESTEPLSKLRTRILDAQSPELRTICQHCCIDHSREMDHYLPKSIFPDFAVHGCNLIPMCGTCNGKKSNIFRVAGVRQIFNLYFDSLPTERYLRVTVRYDDDVPVARFSIDGAVLSADERKRVHSHFESLDLLQRYSEVSSSKFAEVASIVRETYRAASAAEAADFLSREATRLSGRYSKNYWEAVLLDALSNSQRFLDEAL